MLLNRIVFITANLGLLAFAIWLLYLGHWMIVLPGWYVYELLVTRLGSEPSSQRRHTFSIDSAFHISQEVTADLTTESHFELGLFLLLSGLLLVALVLLAFTLLIIRRRALIKTYLVFLLLLQIILVVLLSLWCHNHTEMQIIVERIARNTLLRHYRLGSGRSSPGNRSAGTDGVRANVNQRGDITYMQEGIQHLIDQIQLRLACCGGKSHLDFVSSPGYLPSLVEVPPSCCHQGLVEMTTCLAKPSPENSHMNRPCGQAIWKEWLADQYKSVVCVLVTANLANILLLVLGSVMLFYQLP
ncbi:unnamed protein product [Protopolystoma xenopodis]|uniref:Tetraspanin n=1 Tax=Protopolystoma xenopodis TaxID=117903 RepID=A0A448WSR6_9PLAT|nr:unnamed protein product [Protopolystoma xenopodis]